MGQYQGHVAACFGVGGQAPAGAQPPAPVPVIIEARDIDPCSYGRVHGLDPKGDGFLAVKSGPGVAYARLDKLIENRTVYICGERGDWYAIVYPGLAEDCGVSSPWSKSRSYTGPCKAGWVHRRWIEILAG